jgi:hypothetical protein
MEDKFRFLQNFSSQMAEIELPGEFLIPKVRIFCSIVYSRATCEHDVKICPLA